MTLSVAEGAPSSPSNPLVPLAPLVLLGAGHAHLVMMRQWMQQGWQPPTGTLIISAGAQAWYSGMMPGLIAGRFSLADCAIDLLPLCNTLGITLVQGLVTALNSNEQCLTLTDGSRIHYQLLSINSGSQPVGPAHSDGSVKIVPAKPFPEFIRHWQQWQYQSPASLMVLGGGAAAFELALALKRQFPGCALSLACSGELLHNHGSALQALAAQWLARAGIHVYQHSRVDRIHDQQVFAGQQPLQAIDALILATGASALPWYANSGLSCDAQGFIRVDQHLQTSDQQVFAAGDAVDLPGSVRSGVFSVRHGPVLAHNLRAKLEGQSLQTYQPQKTALALLATGDGGALMSYGSLAMGSRLTAPLLGRWKDTLDVSFMKRHRLLR